MSYNKKDYKKTKINEYYKKKYAAKKQIKTYIKLAESDIINRIIKNLSVRMHKKLLEKNVDRNISYMTFIGCTPQELKEHLSDNFTDGMNYDNYGQWEVDHIIPISHFDLCDIDEAKKCFNYKNLQPLWKKDNRTKSNKLF